MSIEIEWFIVGGVKKLPVRQCVFGGCLRPSRAWGEGSTVSLRKRSARVSDRKRTMMENEGRERDAGEMMANNVERERERVINRDGGGMIEKRGER